MSPFFIADDFIMYLGISHLGYEHDIYSQSSSLFLINFLPSYMRKMSLSYVRVLPFYHNYHLFSHQYISKRILIFEQKNNYNFKSNI